MYIRVASKANVNADPATAWSELGGGIFVDSIVLTGLTNNIRKKIDNKVVTDNIGNNFVPISLVYADELNSGIILTKADLVITYYTAPSAPTGLNRNFLATESNVITTISWSASLTGPTTGYTVYYRKQLTSTTWGSWSYVSVNAQTLSTVINLNLDSTYECYVRSTNPAGGTDSQTLTFTTPPPPSISGPSEVCYSASTFSMNNGPSGTIHWSVTGSFSFDPTSNVTTSTSVQPSLYKIIGSNAGGTLTAREGSANGTICATKSLTACVTSITGPDEIASGCSGQYNLVNAPPAQTIYWTVSNTSLFSVVSSNCPTTVTKLGLGSGNVTLSARIGSTSGTVIATKTISTPALPVISGTTTLICYKSASPYYSFSATNFGSGFTWGTSSNLTIISGQSTSNLTVNAASSSSSGAAWVSVKSDCGVELVRYNLWVGAPTISYISGPTSVVAGNGYAYYANDVYGSPSSYEWQLNYSTNEYSPSPAFPNPTSDVFNIEVGQSSSAKTQGASITFDIRLYDGQGNLLRQQKTKGGTIQFNVSTLPDGLYFLHIYDGINSTPEIQQIEVAR